MRLTFAPEARADLDEIFDWLSRENPRAAVAVIERIEAKLNRVTNPTLAHMGRPGRVEGTRELIEYPYIIVYAVDDDAGEIVVLAAMHGARSRDR